MQGDCYIAVGRATDKGDCGAAVNVFLDAVDAEVKGDRHGVLEDVSSVLFGKQNVGY